MWIMWLYIIILLFREGDRYVLYVLSGKALQDAFGQNQLDDYGYTRTEVVLTCIQVPLRGRFRASVCKGGNYEERVFNGVDGCICIEADK